MVTFDQYLVKLYTQGFIDEESAMLSGSDKSRLGQMLDRIKSEKGETVTDIKGLELDTEYGQKW
jgi:twitching motility protein PilT